LLEPPALHENTETYETVFREYTAQARHLGSIAAIKGTDSGELVQRKSCRRAVLASLLRMFEQNKFHYYFGL